MRRIGVLVAFALLGAGAPASAALIVGDTVHLELTYDTDAAGPGGTIFSGDAILGAGVEFSVPIQSDGSFGEGTLLLDLDANTVTFAQTNSPFPDILLFQLALTSLNSSSGPIVGVTPLLQGNVFTTGFGPTSFSIVNTQNFNPPSNFRNIYQLEFAAVPEPTTLLLFGTGMAAAIARRRQRIKKN